MRYISTFAELFNALYCAYGRNDKKPITKQKKTITFLKN